MPAGNQFALGQGDGKPVLTRTITGVDYHPRNWHNLAVQITGTKVVWLLDGNVVGQAGGVATVGTKLGAKDRDARRLRAVDEPSPR